MHFLCMVGTFFIAYHLSMDIEKLYENLMHREEIKEIPIIYVVTVLTCILDVISSGDCFYEDFLD